MTTRRELSYAVSLTRVHEWGTAARCLELLASHGENLNVEIELSRADMAEWLGISGRTIYRALRNLVAWGMVDEVAKGRGTAPSRWRIVDPIEWGATAPWAIDRREVVIHLAAFSWLQARAQEGASPRAQARGLAELGARAQARGLGAPLHNVPRDPSDLSSFKEGAMDRRMLSERAEALAQALEQGTGRAVFGKLLGRIEELAERSNGSFPRVLEEARRPGLQSPFAALDRLEAVADRITAESVTARREARPVPTQRFTNRAYEIEQIPANDRTLEEAAELAALYEQIQAASVMAGNIEA